MIFILTNIYMMFWRSCLCWWWLPSFRNWKMFKWNKSKASFEMMIIIKCCTLWLIISTIRKWMINKVRRLSTDCTVVMSRSYTSRWRWRWRRRTIRIDLFLKFCYIIWCIMTIIWWRIRWWWRRWWCTSNSLLRTWKNRLK